MKKLFTFFLVMMMVASAASGAVQELDGNYFMLGHHHQLVTLVHYDKGHLSFVGIVGDEITGIWLNESMLPNEVSTTETKTTVKYGPDKVYVQTGGDVARLSIPDVVDVDGFEALVKENVENRNWKIDGYHKNKGADCVMQFCTSILTAADSTRYREEYADLFLNADVFMSERVNSRYADDVRKWADTLAVSQKYDYVEYVTVKAADWGDNMPNELYAWIIRMIKGVNQKQKDNPAEVANVPSDTTITVGPPTIPEPENKDEKTEEKKVVSKDDTAVPAGFEYPSSILMTFDGYSFSSYNAKYEYTYDHSTGRYKLASERVPQANGAAPAYRQRIVVWLDGPKWIVNSFKTSAALPYEAPRQFSDAELKKIVRGIKPGASYTGK